MAWNKNLEKVLSAALAVEQRQNIRPWTAADVIAFLGVEEGGSQPSDATVYRLLHRLDEQLDLVTSTISGESEERTPGRPRREYELTQAGLEAARDAANWLFRLGIAWAQV